MKALCIVAHPDDCIIFAWPFIEEHHDFDWTILYLTYKEGDGFRADEISFFWNSRGIKTHFLGNVDTYVDMETNEISFDTEQARNDIQSFCKDYDILLTHASDGDYGHIHHKFVHECVVAANKPTVFFASQHDMNLNCTRTEQLNLTEIPLHADVVRDFEHIETGNYQIDDSTKELIYGNP